MKMKKSQEEINIISAMLIPVLAFLLLLVILYINFLPMLDVAAMVLLFAHDIGSLTESAYGTPGDIKFVYTGPIPCEPDYQRGLMNCSKGKTWIAIYFLRENPTYNIKYHNYSFYAYYGNDPSIYGRYKIIPGVSFVTLNYYSRLETLTGVKTIDKRGRDDAVQYPSEANLRDLLVLPFTHVLHLGGVVIQKQDKNFFGTLSQTHDDVSTIGDLLSELVYFCNSDKPVHTFNMTYLWDYAPTIYSSTNFDYVTGRPVPVNSTGDRSGRLFCITKYSSDHPYGISAWKDYECYDFLDFGRATNCYVTFDVSMGWCDQKDEDGYCVYALGGDFDLNQVRFISNHTIDYYTQVITMTKSGGDIILNASYRGLME